MPDSLVDLQEDLRRFAAERSWAQFHTPKNLAMALSGEAGEVTALLQWLTPEGIDDLLRDETGRVALSHELADVLIYLVRLADVAGVDLLEAARSKLALNGERYPVALAHGTATKYTFLTKTGTGSEDA